MLLAAANAVRLGLLYQRRLGIEFSEVTRYLCKCFNLGLCYAAFVDDHSINGALGAGKAAFLCCAYDVASDWQKFDEATRWNFEYILRALAPPWSVDLTLDLFQQKQDLTISEDGLERGVIALEFVTGLIGSTPNYSQYGLKRLGTLLQIVDDALDLEQDRARSERNSLLGVRRTDHLNNLVKSGPFLEHVFKKSLVMLAVLRLAHRKAEVLLKAAEAHQPPTATPAPSRGSRAAPFSACVGPTRTRRLGRPSSARPVET